LIEKQHPKLAISEMPKEKRVGKVFIDWSQNADYKTTAGVYSLRAKQQRPFVSMPVAWDELERALKRSQTDALSGHSVWWTDGKGATFSATLEASKLDRHTRCDAHRPALHPGIG
jgi:LigD-like primase-polymerase